MAEDDDLFPDAPGDPERSGIGGPDDKWPAVLADMLDALVYAARRAGVDAVEAWVQAERAVMAVAAYVGGRSIYLPRGDRVIIAIRDRRIWSEFTGDNTIELAKKYNLVERQIQRILAEQRAIHTKRIQADLF